MSPKIRFNREKGEYETLEDYDYVDAYPFEMLYRTPACHSVIRGSSNRPRRLWLKRLLASVLWGLLAAALYGVIVEIL